MKMRIAAVLVTAAITLGCGANSSTPSHPKDTSNGPATSDSTPPLVNDDQPLSLQQWRALAKDAKAAIREKDRDERILKCRGFLKNNGNHSEAKTVSQALIDALTEGNFDAADLADQLVARASYEPDNYSLPISLVEKYYLKHDDLPLPQGIKLLEMTRQRVAKQRKLAALESNERNRERSLMFLGYRANQSYVFEAALHLQRNDATKALAVLAAAEPELATVPHDVSVVSSDGSTRTINGGLRDSFYLVRATAELRKGDREKAKAAFAKMLGFVSNLKLRGYYDEVRKGLGLEPTGARIVGAEALPAQDFDLEGVDGKKLKLSSLRGKVVLVAFWATWCGPCKKELPELRKFAKSNKDKGVEVLAVSIDDYSDRGSIKPFLEKHGLSDLQVLYEDPKQLTNYNYSGIPALYVVDRKGRLASGRTGYDPELRDKLRTEIAPLVAGTKDSMRELFTIEKAPQGWGEIWKSPVSGSVQSLALAPARGGKAGEIAAAGRKGFIRWSGDGTRHETKPLTVRWVSDMRASDLDQDGNHEWLLSSWGSLHALDHTGTAYWEYKTSGRVRIAGIHNLDKHPFEEVVIQGDKHVIALKADAREYWKTAPIAELKASTVAGDGSIVYQDGKLIRSLDNQGAITATTDAVEGKSLRQRQVTPTGHADVFAGQWDARAHFDYDIDGDGQKDTVLAKGSGIVAFDKDGNEILRIRSNDVELTARLGDIDGKAGDELAVWVEHYGLVVLGKK